MSRWNDRWGRAPGLLLATVLPVVCLAGAELSQRQVVLAAMAERPADFWPRGLGHVVLAAPGSSEGEKAYHEPGGSFSPAFASFGVSIWVGDAAGRLLGTSDTLPLEQLSQRFTWPETKGLPTLETDTPFYRAAWSGTAPGVWELSLTAKGSNTLALVVRSVGPAGGPLESLDWDEKRLLINKRWTLTFSGRPKQVQVGPEAVWSRERTGNAQRQWSTDNGWGFARFPLTGKPAWRVDLRDTAPKPPAPLECSLVRSVVNLRLPEPAFGVCLDAQIAHLLMGLVGKETRPGEPNNYPLNWLRDGAYVLVALARAGQVPVARQLCEPFATQDFFGGFGAEADAPGLAIWALVEIAGLAGDPVFDRWLWPHVERKASLIEEMLAAKEPMRRPFHGPVVPQHQNRKDLDLVCGPAKDGLIAGRMDWHRPVLFVNAVSYRGLSHGALLAERLGHTAPAGRWRAAAAGLRQAWNAALASPDFENERNYSCGLYPTWVVTDPAAYRVKLQTFLRGAQDAQGLPKGLPLWTYFNLATAHQWLALGQPELAWKQMRWFWRRQASPGLYTWWEGEGEENGSGRWERSARGWVRPPHVTPHYWTAAEMTLLQLEMLAYVDESASEPTLVLGAGVPRDWFDQPMSVTGVGTRLGKVDWHWEAGRLRARVHGPRCPVRLGASFPPDTALDVGF